MAKKLIFTQDELNKLINEYTNGKSLRQLVKEFGHSREMLSKALKESGIKIRDNTENSRKFHHNENYFEVIDTEEKAYWLGFLYADGYIDVQNNIGITLSSVDIKHLEKFKTCVQATNPINIYHGSGYNSEGEFARILLKSNKMKSDLIDKGMLEHKTLLLQFPEKVPESLIRDFIRGYLDGDGSISTNGINNGYKIGFTGTYEMMSGICNFLNGSWTIRPKGNAYQIQIGGNLQVLRIFDLLYKDATVYLQRKYDKFIELSLKYSES